MEQKKVEGIVIGETLYSESSKILKVFTKDGIISVMSKGCRKPKSKLRETSTKLIYATFNINYKKEGISTLINADIIYLFKNILMDYKDMIKISYALYLVELTTQTIKEEQLDRIDYESIYNLLINSLIKINEGLNPLAVISIVELKYLDYLGVKPSIDGCSLCGSDKNIITITADSYGLICKNCYKNERIINNETIKMLRMLYYVDMKRVTKLDIDSNILKEIIEFLNEYYDKHTGIYLKTKDNLKNLSKLNYTN
jgi:DNA repair protein RecO